MNRAPQDRGDVDRVLERYRGLRIVPVRDGLRVAGKLAFNVVGPGGVTIADSYDVDVRLPSGMPDHLPEVRETGGRIPRDFHKLEGGLLCLGSPTELRLRLHAEPTLATVIEGLVIPYLYGHSYFAMHGKPPYGELEHGPAGIRQSLAGIFHAGAARFPERFLWRAGMKKRIGNKHPCPCGSRRRLGRCHNAEVNSLRRRMGRSWCRDEFRRASTLLPKNARPPGPQ